MGGLLRLGAAVAPVCAALLLAGCSGGVGHSQASSPRPQAPKWDCLPRIEAHPHQVQPGDHVVVAAGSSTCGHIYPRDVTYHLTLTPPGYFFDIGAVHVDRDGSFHTKFRIPKKATTGSAPITVKSHWLPACRGDCGGYGDGVTIEPREEMSGRSRSGERGLCGASDSGDSSTALPQQWNEPPPWPTWSSPGSCRGGSHCDTTADRCHHYHRGAA